MALNVITEFQSGTHKNRYCSWSQTLLILEYMYQSSHLILLRTTNSVVCCLTVQGIIVLMGSK